MQPEPRNHCPWICAAPTGPDTPFDWPFFFIIDALRIFMTAGAVVMIGISAWAVRRAESHGQKARFLMAALLFLSVSDTELSHLGDSPHRRFMFNLVAVAVGLWAYHQHLFHELPARDKSNGADGRG
jgi:hypothetical protein